MKISRFNINNNVTNKNRNIEMDYNKRIYMINKQNYNNKRIKTKQHIFNRKYKINKLLYQNNK